MTQPVPAPPAPSPPNGPLYPGPNGIRDIELIHDIIMGEQPGTAVAIGDLWVAFAKALRDASASAQGTADSLFEWESDHAQPAYLERSDETVAKLEETAEVSDRVGEALRNLGQVMQEGQDRMRDLYDEYKTAMIAFQDAIMNGDAQAPDNVVYQYFGEYLNNMRTSPDGTLQGQFKELWDEKALALEREISSSYNEPYSRLFNIWYYAFPWLVPIDYVYHPGGEGMPFPDGAAGGPPPPPAGAGSPPVPPAAPAPPAPPTAAVTMVAPLTAPTSVPGPPPPPSSLITTATIVPPGTPAPPTPSATPSPPALPAGAVIAPRLTTPPAGVVTPPGGLVAPPGATTRSAGATQTDGSLPPGARTLGMEAPPPGVLEAGSAPPGAADPEGPPGATLADPGTPGAGATMPPGAGMGMPPGMRPPPGMGTAPPPANAGRRAGPAETPPTGTATPAQTVPEAFLPPTAGLNPPVLGDPQRPQRTRPGSAVEAPRTWQAGNRPSTGGGGTPPILANRHLTGPRPTQTQARDTDRLARQERAQRIREILRSALARDLPEATSPVLDTPATADSPSSRRRPEVPASLHGRQGVAEIGLHPRPTPPADRTTRRPLAEPAATPDTEAPATWEVDTPGGPVVSSTSRQPKRRRSRRRDTPGPRALGGSG